MALALVADERQEGESGPTVKAVLAEAQRLRERAERELAADPYAKPYSPSDRLAYSLTAQHGPEGALRELQRRAVEAAARYREQTEISERARKRLDRQHRVAEAGRRQRLSGMTLGQRLDEALAALSTASEVGAAGFEAPVSHGKSDGGSPGQAEGRALYLRERALLLVTQIEDEVPRGRRRTDEGKAA